MRTPKYWAERSTMQMDRGMQAADKTLVQLNKAYGKTAREIQGEISGLYAKYGDQYGLTYAQATQAVTGGEFRDWRMSVAEYVDRIAETGDDELRRELDTLATRSRVTRLQAVETAIKVNVAELQAQEAALVEKQLAGTYSEAFYRQAYDVQQGVGLGQALEMLRPEQITKALAYPWSGASFSDRIWTDKRMLANTLQNTLTRGLIQGKGIRPMAKELNDVMGAGKYASERLIRTETAYQVEQGALAGYVETEIDEYTILATLDSRTSALCQKQDGKVYKTAEAVVGKNYPPFHPNCRTTTVPHFGDEELDAGTRLARNAKGEVYEVPASMTYPEWFKKHVIGTRAT